MIDLGEAIATPKDHRRALVSACVMMVPALLIAPVVGRMAGISYPLLAIVISLAIAMIAMSGVLLWAQARVARSVPLLFLAAAYGATAFVMMVYLLLYHGLWPALAEAVSADPQSSGWLWLEWHLLFALSPAVYIAARRWSGHYDEAAFRRLQHTTLVALIALLAATIAPMVWIDGLPAFYLHGSFTSLATTMSAVVVVAAGASIAMLYVQSRFRSVLDVWLGIATVCLVADVLLSRAGAMPGSVGWYLSRGYVLIASGTLLTILILQTAKVYAQLASTTDRLRDESLTDVLTGLANRRSFDARLAQALADCARAERPAALLMIDIDNFKAYNDAFGHPAGDACLRAVASALRTAVPRASDLVARFGGEEMAVVMAETELGGAAVVAERIRASVQRLAIRHAKVAIHDVVTVSIGIAAVDNAANVTPEVLLEQADRALYLAKRGGRNRATTAAVVFAAV